LVDFIDDYVKLNKGISGVRYLLKYGIGTGGVIFRGIQLVDLASILSQTNNNFQEGHYVFCLALAGLR
jgi:hypothetical protein